MTNSRNVLQVFSKPPRPGQVKSRLIPALGEAGAASLYRRLLEQTLETAAASHFGTLELWTTDPADHETRQLAVRHGARLQRQAGADLGERMSHALNIALSRARFAVLIGCDCPQLTSVDLRQAAGWLRSGADAVLGPATDGGYYLIALRRPILSLFSGIDWGTGQVLEQTRSRLRRGGLAWHELPEYRDIDRPEDLDYLPADRDWGLPAKV